MDSSSSTVTSAIREFSSHGRQKALFVSLLLFLGGVWSLSSIVVAQFWSETEGTILRSNRLLCKNSSKPTEDFHVRYRYTVGNRTYESDRFAIGGLQSYDVPDPGEPDPIGDLIRKYPAGSRVPVYYNPRDPAAACLSRSMGSYTWLLFGSSGLLLLLGLIGKDSISPIPANTEHGIREELPSGAGNVGIAHTGRSGYWPDWMIAEVRDNLNAARRLPLWRRRRVYRVGRPLWARLSRDRRCDALFETQDVLFAEGLVVWAHIVQANELLFEKGWINCPAAVLFSADPRSFPSDLEVVAERIFALKGVAHSNPALAEVGAYLADEMEARFNWKLPAAATGGANLFLTSILVVRKHLPGQRLAGSFFPVLVHPEKTSAAMIVPSRFWPESLLGWWDDLGTDSSGR